jgi:hypothetical protein
MDYLSYICKLLPDSITLLGVNMDFKPLIILQRYNTASVSG